MAWFKRKSADEVARRVKEHELAGHRWRRFVKNPARVVSAPARVVSAPFSRSQKQSPTFKIDIQQPNVNVSPKKGPGVLFVLILIVGFWLFWNFVHIGEVDVWKANIEVKFGTQIAEATQFAKDLGKQIKDNPRQIGDFSDPRVVRQKPLEKRGVLISKFEPESEVYTKGEPIELIGVIDIINEKENKVLTLSCDSENYFDTTKIKIGNEESDGEIKTIVKGSSEGITQQIEVKCILPKGFNIGDEKKIRTAKKVSLNVKYDVRAKTTLELYSTTQEIIEKLGRGTKIFNNYAPSVTKDKLWGGDGIIKSVQIGPSVPIPPSLELIGKQPITTNEIKKVRIRLFNTPTYKAQWGGGELDRLLSVNINPLNKQITLNSKECDKYPSGRLSSSILKKVNSYCGDEETNKEECLGLKKDIILPSCGIELREEPYEEKFVKHLIETNVAYVYKVKKKTSVEIVKQKSLFAETDKQVNKISSAAVLFTENLLNNF